MAEKLGVLMGLLALQVATVSDLPTPVGLCHSSLMGLSVAVTTCAWSDCRLLWYVPGLIYYSLLWHVPGFIVACYGMCLILFIIACYGVCLVLIVACYSMCLVLL